MYLLILSVKSYAFLYGGLQKEYIEHLGNIDGF